MCTKGFLNYFNVIIVLSKVVFKDEIVKFSKKCGTCAIKESGGVKVQIMEFQKDNNNNKLPEWFDCKPYLKNKQSMDLIVNHI